MQGSITIQTAGTFLPIFFKGLQEDGQIDPEQDRTVDPKRARQYLERYFSDTKISIYRERAEDFLKERQRQI